jgi:Terminase RNaseH-like domain/Helicase
MASNYDKVLLESALSAMRSLGLQPDPWQLDVLVGKHQRLLLNCCRQSGKSTTVALLSVLETVGLAGTRVLMVAPSLRQSRLLFRIASDYLSAWGMHFVKRRTMHEINLRNQSMIACLPCKEETIRGYADIHLLILDEAARVPDDVYKAVCPMLAVSDGRLICLSTPYGRRGFFYDAWAHGGDDWQRIEVPVDQVPRISADYLARARRQMGESWYRQEFCCSFEALEGLVYPDFARCVVPAGPVPPGRWFGGIDFGLRNPFAAVWGVVDRDDVLWLVGEHYARDRPLAYHLQHLPRNVTWYADPEGAREITELHCAGLTIRKGDNAQRPGIAAVRARLENGTLKVMAGACPNLLAEAQLYRYDPETPNAESPLKEHDHALDALRYLISKLDWKKMARMRRGEPPEDAPPPGAPDAAGGTPAAPQPKPRKWLSLYNEALWTRIG